MFKPRTPLNVFTIFLFEHIGYVLTYAEYIYTYQNIYSLTNVLIQ